MPSRSLLAVALLLGCSGGVAATGGAGGHGGSPPDGGPEAGPFPDAGDAGDAPDAPVEPGARCGATGTWRAAGMSNEGRYAPGLAVRPDGQVVIAGGWDVSTGAESDALLYDPKGGALAPAGKLSVDRNFPAVAPVARGFLFVGGFNDFLGSVGAADVYVAATGRFLRGPSLHEVRELHTATALPDGRVVVVGGLSAAGLTVRSSAEIYDPATATFTLAGDLLEPRFGHAALWVDEVGEILIAGGKGIGPNGDVFRTRVEWYDPAKRTFSPGATLSVGRDRPTASLLPDGRILIAGGSNKTDGTLSSTELFDLRTNTFAPGPVMKVRRMAHETTALADGKLVLTGGWSDTEVPSQSTATTELFDPLAMTFTPLPPLAAPRHDHRAVALGACGVLVVGGLHVHAGVTETPLAIERLDLGELP